MTATERLDRGRNGRDRNASNGKDSRPDGRKGQSLYVGNIPWDTDSRDLENLFAEYGPVHEATVVVDHKSGRSRGFGFVNMPFRAAKEATKELNGSSLGGRDLRVRSADDKPKRR